MFPGQPGLSNDTLLQQAYLVISSSEGFAIIGASLLAVLAVASKQVNPLAVAVFMKLLKAVSLKLSPLIIVCS